MAGALVFCLVEPIGDLVSAHRSQRFRAIIAAKNEYAAHLIRAQSALLHARPVLIGG